jgi:hypothetical protein
MIFEVHNANVELVDEVGTGEVEMGEVGGVSKCNLFMLLLCDLV